MQKLNTAYNNSKIGEILNHMSTDELAELFIVSSLLSLTCPILNLIGCWLVMHLGYVVPAVGAGFQN